MKHLVTYRAGQPGYIDAHRRGTVDIWHDQRRYIYKSTLARNVRAFIARAWQQEHVRVTGRHPSYTLENHHADN